jgi:hypothetical protein
MTHSGMGYAKEYHVERLLSEVLIGKFPLHRRKVVAPASNERIQIVSPWTEAVIASVAAASPADVDKAVAAARHAFDHGPGRRCP